MGSMTRTSGPADREHSARQFGEAPDPYVIQGVDNPDLEAGIAVIRDQAKQLPGRPGVYRMLNAAGDVLYVGKARSLKNRVMSYTQPARLPQRLLRMVAQTRSMEVVTTHTEAEALLLEANLIKRFRTPYNVLLRDDKSFPYIYLRESHDWAQITKHRGARTGKGVYYGPFASAGSVNRTLNTLQRVFLLRSCSDSVFNNRSRPCLLYQIKRCSAPCVERITADDYAELVREAKDFLAGRSQAVQKRLSGQMTVAAESMDFERAAVFRDRLRALAHVQSQQGVNSDAAGDADVVALASKGGVTCIQVFFLRGGQNWGNRAFFPRHDKAEDAGDILLSFLSQFYDDKAPPRRLLLDRDVPEQPLLAEALSLRAERKVDISAPKRGALTALVATAARNAAEELDRRLAESASQMKHLTGVAELFDLERMPQRIEVYDNSHIQGTNALGAMIVAGPEGFRKAAYRTWNIKSAELTPGDDFGMMREVLKRRFSRLMSEDEDGAKGMWPDLVLIDGGVGQLSAALDVMAELGIDDLVIAGVSKGPDRNAGREQFHLPGGRSFTLEPNNPVLYYLQRLRDEAHRFAIGHHRAKRTKEAVTSPLDEIAGIGPTRKRALLHHFGTARAVGQAALADLEAVSGISKQVAKLVYDHFHPNG
jgi:excinuclease ABC subunit C